MEKAVIKIDTEYIAMDQLLKFSGVAATGGQAFMLVEKGAVTLNGVQVNEKRKKVRPGDVVLVDGQLELTVAKN